MDYTMFISYSHCDKEWAVACHELIAQTFVDIDIFWDKDLIGGDDFWSTLYEKSSHSDLFLYLVSESSVELGSGCAGEIKRALEYKRYIIPVILPSGVPNNMRDELKKFQYVDFRNADCDDLRVDYVTDLFKSVYEGIRNTSPISQYHRKQMFLLYDILNEVTNGEHGVSKEIYRRGYEVEYYSSPYLDRGVSEEVCREVWDILDMMSDLQYSWKKLDDDEKAQCKDAEYVINNVGFGGNTEGQHLSYMRFLRLQDKWDYLLLSFDDGNSHHPNLPRYRNMLSVYRSIMKGKEKDSPMPAGGHVLSCDELCHIIGVNRQVELALNSST